MRPILKRSILGLVCLAVACGEEGNQPSSPTSPPTSPPSMPNSPPSAAFASSCDDLVCTFSDSSSDADGRITGYQWSYGDQSLGGTTRNAEHVYAAAGAYTVSLMVTDDSGASAGITHFINAVLPVDIPPVASFGSTCVDLTCTFSDSSSDPDGSVESRQWAFGDGATASGPNPAHTYAAAGAYQVQLTVADDRGTIATATREVTVTAVRGLVLDPHTITVFARRYYYYRSPRVNVRITASGVGRLHWKASTTSSWITLSDTSGTTPSTLVVTVSTKELLGGYFWGTITVSAAGAPNSPQTVAIRVYLR